MIDFPIFSTDVPTRGMWAICGLMYFFILAYYYKPGFWNIGYKEGNSKNHFFVFFVLIFALCAFYNGDWMHMQQTVTSQSGIDYTAGYGSEIVYQYITDIVKGNYLLFRLILWGGGIILLLQIFKLCDLDRYKCLYFLFAIYITAFVYTRAGIALSIFYLGLVVFYKNFESGHRSIQKILIGLLIMYASTFFHRSLIVLVLLFPLSLLPIRKKTMPILIILFGCLVLLSQTVLQYGTDLLMESDEYSHRIEVYQSIAGSKSFSFGLNGFFFIWYKSIVHVPFLICTFMMWKVINSSEVPIMIQAVFRFGILLYAFSIFMLVIYGSASALYYRYEGMLYIPITIMARYLFQNNYMNFHRYSFLFWLGTLCMIKDFTYYMLFS